MRTVAIIQARMGSTRLPGKVLLKLPGGTVLEHVVTRVRDAKRLDSVVVATTTSAANDPVVRECERLDVPSFRGSEQDVLDRYFRAAQQFKADVIVRVTADCPLFDGALLDRMLAQFNADYMSNVMERRFPRGLDAELFTFQALARAHREATQPFEREHVTPYFYQHPEMFRLQSYQEPSDLSTHRWTLDTPEDLRLIEMIYEELYAPGRRFTTADVLNLLQRRPELTKINGAVQQKTLTTDVQS